MPKEILVHTLKLEITPAVAAELDGQSRICNWLYNTLLEKCQVLKNEFIQTILSILNIYLNKLFNMNFLYIKSLIF